MFLIRPVHLKVIQGVHLIRCYQSMDTNIKNTEFNDLVGFIKKYPTLQIIVLNGGKAKAEYRRYIRSHKIDFCGLEEYFFTSTSSLSISAGWPLERIIEQWSEIRNFKCCIPE